MRTLALYILLASLVCAQSTGNVYTHDMRINGQGSGTTSMELQNIDAGPAQLNWQVKSYASTPVLGMLGVAAPGAVNLGGGSYLDLDPSSLSFLFDGTGVYLPSGLTPFLQTSPTSTLFNLSFPTNLAAGTSLSVQSAVFSPYFAAGGATTQAFTLTAIVQGTACTGGQPGPTTDDGYVQANLNAPVSFYGTSYNDLYVNANGSITFGQGSSLWTPTPSSFLAGPPRIAGCWNDFSPNVGGTVTWTDGGYFRACWDNVPVYGAGPTDLNSFSISINRGSSNLIVVSFGNMDLNNGSATPLVGVSPGGNLGNGQQVDLSSIPTGGSLSFSSSTAIYESFLLSSGSFDLANDFVVFNGGSSGGAFGYSVY